MTKTTHCNNDFQAELMKMLRNMGVSTNSTLTLNNENNGMVVITSRNCSNPAVPQNPSLTNYVFRCRYGGETVFVIVKKAAMNSEFKELTFLNEINNCENSDFSQTWSLQVENFKQQSSLNCGDIELLKSFGNKLGTTDCFHQTQLCEEYIKRFEERCEYEKSKLSEKLRLCKAGGVVCGLALLILLL